MSWSFTFEGTRDAVLKDVAAEVERLALLETMTKVEVADVRASGAFVAAHLGALVLGGSVAPSNQKDVPDDPRVWNAVRAQASGTQTDGMANLHVHVERKSFSL